MATDNFQKIGTILGSIKFKEPVAPPIYEHWLEAAGDAIADHTVNLDVRGDTLEVAVDSPTWAHEVIHNQQSILIHLQSSHYRKLTAIAVKVKIPPPKRAAP